MAANFLGFFGKKKEENAAPQDTPLSATPQSAIPSAPIKAPAPGTIGRKKVTQRLSLKGIKAPDAAPAADPSKIQLPGMAPKEPLQASESLPQVEGAVEVPFTVVLGALPDEALTADKDALMQAPEAAVSVHLPLAPIMASLSSGKIEMTLQDLSAYIPEGFMHPLDALGAMAGNTVLLPLGQIVSRIPPHMLTLRSDQRPIDSTVLSMEDPFSREMLEKAQAEAAARAAAAAGQAPEPAPEPVDEEPVAEAPSADFSFNAPPVIDDVPPAEAAATEPSAEAASFSAFDAAALAAAEAELEASNKAAEAGVELPDAPVPPPTAMAPVEEESEPVAQASFEEPAAEVPAEAEMAEAPEQPEVAEEEIDPALMAWAKKMAEEEQGQAAGAPEKEEEPAAGLDSFSAGLSAFDAGLGKVSEETVEEAVPELEPEPEMIAPVEEPAEDKPEAAPGAFDFPKPEAAFDVLSAPTRPIPRPAPAEVASESVKEEPEAVVEPVANEPAAKNDFAAPAIATKGTEEGRGGGIRLSKTINKYLGISEDEEVSFSEVMGNIRRWPGMSGCVISGKDGLPISAVIDDQSFTKSLSAFAPKILSRVNDQFVDLGMPEVTELHVPMDDVSTFIFREADVYFIVLYKDASLPHWYRKVIKTILEEIASSH